MQDFWKMVSECMTAHPDWRLGQAVFNVADHKWPDITISLRGKVDVDCYYDDRNVGAFMLSLYEKGVK